MVMWEKNKTANIGAEGMTQQLKSQESLAEDTGSVPSPYMVSYNHL